MEKIKSFFKSFLKKFDFKKNFLKNKKGKIKKLWKNKVFRIFLFVFLFLSLFFLSTSLLYANKIAYGIKIAGNSIGGLTEDQAVSKIAFIEIPKQITIKENGNTYEIDTNNFDLQVDAFKSAERAYEYTRTGNFLVDYARKVTSLFSKTDLGLKISLTEELLYSELSNITDTVIKPPVFPGASFENGQVVISSGEKGTKVDMQKLQADIEKNISLLKKEPIVIEKEEVDPTLTDSERQELLDRANKFLGKKIMLSFEYSNFTYDQSDILPLLSKKDNFYEEKIDKIVEDIASSIDREPQDSVFSINGGKVQEFVPSKDGVLTKKEDLKNLIKESLNELQTTDEKSLNLQIPVETSAPKITNDEVNNLGIKTLIGIGASTYYHSIASRVYNIGHAAKMINGTLIAPGETFSFNAVVGDISKETGFQQAYVIKDGATVLGDGGGVCQVSTTMFRAALDAGLPIVERRAHSYRVGYYEQDKPLGYDATVYYPTTDLKFTNNTPAHILIQTIYSPSTYSLVFELYGTDDGRVATTFNHSIWDIEAPPEDLYIDDPTLPAGEIKQIDYKAGGAKAKFDYQVKRDGEIIYKKTFYSTYQPWQAKFLRGTAPAI